MLVVQASAGSELKIANETWKLMGLRETGTHDGKKADANKFYIGGEADH